MTRRRPIAVTAVAVCASLLGGCDNSADPASTPSERNALTAPQRRLAQLAQLAAQASYDATYSLRAATGETGTIRIVAAPPSYRVDVSLQGAAPSSYIQSAGRVVSCTTKDRRTSCFLVAGPGEEVPELFDPGVQRLFSDAVADLATQPEAYVVTEAETPPGTASAAACFDVRRVTPTGATSSARPTADPTGFETGQYCFGADGVLTRVAVSTGTLELTARGPAPTAAEFVPPATPVALPELPSASPG